MSIGECAHCCYMFTLYPIWKLLLLILRTVVFSINFNGCNKYNSLYFAFVALQLIAAIMLSVSSFYDPLSSAMIVVGLFWTALVIVLGLPSFCSLRYALFYSFVSICFMVATFLYASLLIACVEHTIRCNKSDAPKADVYRTVAIDMISGLLAFAGLIGCFVMSIKYHWKIFKVGSPFLLFLISRCGGIIAPLVSVLLCCKKRETRLMFNRVTLFYLSETRELAEVFIRDHKVTPAGTGVVGGGMYFSVMLPATRYMFNTVDGPRMLKAAVRLGKCKWIKPNRSGVIPWRSSYERPSEETFTVLQSKGYDSAYLAYQVPEFVVFNPDQVSDLTEVQYPLPANVQNRA